MEHARNPDDGVRIAFDVVGEGEPMLLVHGTGLSSQMWRGAGYVEPLSASHRLLLVDLRGHGRSDKPHEESAYSMARVTGDLVAVLDEVGVERAHLLGYSAGARVGFNLGALHPGRLLSLLLGGGSARSQRGGLDQIFFPDCAAVLENHDMAEFVRRWEQAGGAPAEPVRRAFLANDPRAMAAWFRASEDAPGLSDQQLRALDVPALLFAGSLDHARLRDSRAAQAVLPDAQVAEVSGHDHLSTISASQEVVPLVERFLATW
ncbi:alpha/beta fold hydrolase [Nocardioides campestrisoli]|uniref:alpha/beta fold hydrolase n=1 Tax=Nocardioides campestrisoli TaxID=2736757 RepID=UPI0015E67C1A|nr:alpha/beta hydrolase [Nocardioides campestrisoli]